MWALQLSMKIQPGQAEFLGLRPIYVNVVPSALSHYRNLGAAMFPHKTTIDVRASRGRRGFCRRVDIQSSGADQRLIKEDVLLKAARRQLKESIKFQT